MHPSALIHLFDVLRGAMPTTGVSLLTAGQAFSDRAADLAVTALWQGALIACGLALCLRFAPRISAAHRFTIWLAAFFMLVSLPILSLVAQLPPGAPSVGSSALAGAAAGPRLSLDARWSWAIAAVWVMASLVRAADLAIHSFKLRKIWKEAAPVEIDARAKSVLELDKERVEVCTTKVLDRPSVIGFFSPRILIPDWLFARLTPGELEQIVMHEAEHLRRRDDWSNLLQKLCLMVFPLNPALVWIERRLCREREMACDEGVIRVTRAPRAYAACLASLAERKLERRAEALSLGAWHRRPELVHRVHTILRGKRGLSPRGARMLLGTVGCGLLLGAVELAQCPQLVAFVPMQKAQSAVSPKGANYVPALAARSLPGRPGMANQNAAERSRSEARAVPVVLRSATSRNGALAKVSVAENRPAVMQHMPAALKTAAVEPREHSPRAMELKAEMPKAQTSPAMQEQLVVFTTWEAVETANPKSDVRADYDTDASGGHQAEAAGNSQPDHQPTGRITVTRLILRVFPVSAGMNFPSNSSAGQPGVTAMRGGWLVFQL